MRLAALYACSALSSQPASIAVASATTTSLRGGGEDGRAEPPAEEPRGRHELGSSLWPFHRGDRDRDDDDDARSGIAFERTDVVFPLAGRVDPSGARSFWRRLAGPLPRRLTSSLEYLAVSSFKFVPAQFRFLLPLAAQRPPSPSATFDDGHCESGDAYGDNACHYDWGEDIAIEYDGRIGAELDGDVYVEVSAKIDNLISHSQTCPVCGADPCSIGVSAIPGWNWSFELPPCPLTPELLAGTLRGKLPDRSPVPRLFGGGGGGTVVEGTVWLKRRNGKRNGGGSEEEGDEVLMEVKGNVRLK